VRWSCLRARSLRRDGLVSGWRERAEPDRWVIARLHQHHSGCRAASCLVAVPSCRVVRLTIDTRIHPAMMRSSTNCMAGVMCCERVSILQAHDRVAPQGETRLWSFSRKAVNRVVCRRGDVLEGEKCPTRSEGTRSPLFSAALQTQPTRQPPLLRRPRGGPQDRPASSSRQRRPRSVRMLRNHHAALPTCGERLLLSAAWHRRSGPRPRDAAP